MMEVTSPATLSSDRSFVAVNTAVRECNRAVWLALEFAAVIRTEETSEGHLSALRFLSPLATLSVGDDGEITVTDDARQR